MTVLEERYLHKDLLGRTIETPEGMFYRVAKEIASAEKSFGADKIAIETLTRRFYELMASRQFLPNSPTLMNAGRGKGLQYSACYVLPVGDSLEEIFEAVKRTALIHQSGGGTGFSFSHLRPRGSIVRSSRGVASGPVSFMRVFDKATDAIKQGGMRRGANMGVLRVDHPDVLEFIECKARGGIDNFNISLAATDKFIAAVKNNRRYSLYDPHRKRRAGSKNAAEIFDKIVRMAWQTGDPGMIFIDRVNAGPANPVPAMGPIGATNPCVVGSTRIATERGLIRIENLVRQKRKIKILNDDRVLGQAGCKLRPLEKFWDNGVKEIKRLKTKSGLELLATPDHKVMTTRGWVPVAKLKVGQDKVLIQGGAGHFNTDQKLPFAPLNKVAGANGRIYHFNFPDQWSSQLGQVIGWLVGDGWLRVNKKDSRVGFTFGKKDKPILDHFKPILNSWYGKNIKAIKRENEVWHLSYHSKPFSEFFEKLGVKPVKAGQKEVPEAIFTAPKEAVIGFLRGLFSADGTVSFTPGVNAYVRLTSKSERLLQQTQLLLLNLGIPSGIYNRSRRPQNKFSYQNKNGERKTYLSDGVCFELHISRQPAMKFLQEVGFLQNKHREKIKKLSGKGYYRRSYNDTVVEIKPAGKESVFDITEPVTYSMIANGIVVADCGEQPLYPNESCNLGSINLAQLAGKGKKEPIDWEGLRDATHLAVRFLDNVIEANPFPLPEIAENVKLNRRIGLGVMGWADLLFQRETPYNSAEATQLARKLMKFIRKEAHRASQKLASERGPFPNFKKSIYKDGEPLRNATLTTIAPTGTISIIAGCSSGIEPIFALCFKHRSGDRELTFINPHFEQTIRRANLPKKTWEEIQRRGNLNGVESVPKRLKRVFVTAHEISWKDHIRTQAAFQAGTDNAVSKTINLPHEAAVDDVRQAYLLAYESGCLGITVFRDGCRSEQVLYQGLSEPDKKEEAPPLTIKPRPAVASGQTFRVETPVGTAFVTVNINGQNEPLEVFINVGRAGSDIAADAEAIGRLISLNLRLGSPFDPHQVLEQIIDQLEGIGGGESVGFGKEKVRSLADGIAKTLKNYHRGMGTEQVSEQPSLLKAKRRDLCPACGRATLVFEEGCTRCVFCGYSKC